MSGGYLFPKRQLQSGDVLDPQSFNEDFIPTAERLGGNLNEHNFGATSLRANATVGTNAYYIPHYVTTSSDIGFGATPFTFPAAGAANSHRVSNDGDWDVLTDMVLTFTTNVAGCWILGWLQYGWLGFNGLSQHAYNSTDTLPTNVQFALRVDGRVLEWTVTGQRDTHHGSFLTAKATPERGAGTRLPGPTVPTNYEQTAGCGPEILPVRIRANIDLMPGEHTIEIVARRIPRTGPNLTASLRQYADGDAVVVYNRKLFALEITAQPPSSATTAFTDISVFSTTAEDTLSTAALETNRTLAIQSAYNAVATGNCGRGCFNHNHLPNALLDSASDTQNNVPANTTDDYPGYNTSTFAPARLANTGWWPVDDGAATPLRTDQNGHAGFDLTQSCWILILANVELNDVVGGDETHAAGLVWRTGAVGAFGIGYQTTGAGAPTILGDTEGYVNSYNFIVAGASVEWEAVEMDVPLMEVIDNVVPLGGSIDWFGVYASALLIGGVAGAVTVSWDRGNITAIVLRP